MSGDDSSVRRLIEAAREGDADALNRLLGLYRNYLLFLARTGVDGTLGAKADASDVAQEVLLNAFRGFPRFRGQSERELVAWLRKILARSLAMLARRYRGTARRDVGRERALEQALDRSSFALGKLLPSPQSSPSVGAQRRERSVVLADALADLTEDHRSVIRLRSLRELQWDEVAREMGRSPEAARKLWTRAVQELGRRIEGKQL